MEQEREQAADLAPIKAQVYKDPRPKEYFDRFHERARTRDPDWVYTGVRLVLSIYSCVFFRVRGIAPEKVTGEGAVILAPNHFSFMDHFFLGVSIRRKVRFMAKSQLFAKPMQWIYTHGGVFPVRRGYQDEDAFITATGILERGGCVAMYPEGGRSRSGELSAKPKRGIGRLALLTGAPVVPVAIHGSSKVRNWKRLQFPKVTVRYGDPIVWDRVEDPTREQQQAVAEEILVEIRALYAELDAEGRAGVVRRVRELRRAERAGRKKTATAQRAGLENLARTLSVESARFQIKPVTILPGKATSSAEVAELAAFLASIAGDYHSGCAFELGALG